MFSRVPGMEDWLLLCCLQLWGSGTGLLWKWVVHSLYFERVELGEDGGWGKGVIPAWVFRAVYSNLQACRSHLIWALGE